MKAINNNNKSKAKQKPSEAKQSGKRSINFNWRLFKFEERKTTKKKTKTRPANLSMLRFVVVVNFNMGRCAPLAGFPAAYIHTYTRVCVCVFV